MESKQQILLASLVVAVTIALASVILFFKYLKKDSLISPIIIKEEESQTPEKPLLKYSIKALKKRKVKPNQIFLEEELEKTTKYTSYLFYFYTNKKKVSGLLNMPQKRGKLPGIIMLRGFVSQDTYQTGMGSKRTAQEFTKEGFITLAPDFLGYGQSDKEAKDPMEARFETYTTVLDLLSAIKNLNQSLKKKGVTNIKIDTEKIGLWGHSNGGHIALTILEATSKSYPTVLWAPVSKPFPYSILYYSDEAEDEGKFLRKLVSNFEKEYDSRKYSLTSYLDGINAPIQLHQGKQDQEVPYWWSDEFVEKLESKNKDISYYTYLLEDHNFTKGSWPVIVRRSIDFYKNNFFTIR